MLILQFVDNDTWLMYSEKYFTVALFVFFSFRSASILDLGTLSDNQRECHMRLSVKYALRAWLCLHNDCFNQHSCGEAPCFSDAASHFL